MRFRHLSGGGRQVVPMEDEIDINRIRKRDRRKRKIEIIRKKRREIYYDGE